MNQWTRKVVKHACDSIRHSMKDAVMSKDDELAFDYRGIYTFNRKGLVKFRAHEEGESWGAEKRNPIGFHP